MNLKRLFLAWMTVIFSVMEVGPAVAPLKEFVIIPHITPNMSGAPTQGTAANHTIDASEEKVGGIYTVTKTGNIRAVMLGLGAVTTGATFDVRIENLDSAGNPDTSLFCASSSSTFVVASTDDNLVIKSNDLVADCAVSRGDRIGIFIERKASGSMVLWSDADTVVEYELAVSSNSTSGWVKYARGIGIGLVYDDGTVESHWPHILSGTTASSIALSNATNPNHLGVKMTLPFSGRAVGAFIWADVDSDTNIHMSDGSDVYQSTCTMLSGHRISASASPIPCWFNTTVNFSSGTAFWLFAKPTTASNTTIYIANSTMTYIGGSDGYDIQLSTANDPTSSSSWSNNPSRRPYLHLMVDEIQYPDSGGGGTRAYPF